MPIAKAGPVSFSNINRHLCLPSTNPISLGDLSVRSLCEKPAGPISSDDCRYIGAFVSTATILGPFQSPHDHSLFGSPSPVYGGIILQPDGQMLNYSQDENEIKNIEDQAWWFIGGGLDSSKYEVKWTSNDFISNTYFPENTWITVTQSFRHYLLIQSTCTDDGVVRGDLTLSVRSKATGEILDEGVVSLQVAIFDPYGGGSN